MDLKENFQEQMGLEKPYLLKLFLTSRYVKCREKSIWRECMYIWYVKQWSMGTCVQVQRGTNKNALGEQITQFTSYLDLNFVHTTSSHFLEGTIS